MVYIAWTLSKFTVEDDASVVLEKAEKKAMEKRKLKRKKHSKNLHCLRSWKMWNPSFDSKGRGWHPLVLLRGTPSKARRFRAH